MGRFVGRWGLCIQTILLHTADKSCGLNLFNYFWEEIQIRHRSIVFQLVAIKRWFLFQGSYKSHFYHVRDNSQFQSFIYDRCNGCSDNFGTLFHDPRNFVKGQNWLGMAASILSISSFLVGLKNVRGERVTVLQMLVPLLDLWCRFLHLVVVKFLNLFFFFFEKNLLNSSVSCLGHVVFDVICQSARYNFG